MKIVTEEKREELLKTLSKAESLIEKVEEDLKVKLVVFICHQSLTLDVAYRFNKIIRKYPKNCERLALLIESGGGDIDIASKIVKLLRTYCKSYVAIIPFYAKSAATLLAVGADEIVMCKSGELGPVDPQIRDPITKLFVPASSIKEAINFIEETKDQIVKLSMAEKMPPLLMGAYRGSQKVARQYMEEAFEKLGPKKDEAIHAFTDKYISHGYPIDREICNNLKLPIVFPEEQFENRIYELFETYMDFLTKAEENEEDRQKRGEHLIIHTRDAKCIIVNDKEETDLSSTSTKLLDKTSNC